MEALRRGAQDYLTTDDVNAAALGRAIRFAIARAASGDLTDTEPRRRRFFTDWA